MPCAVIGQVRTVRIGQSKKPGQGVLNSCPGFRAGFKIAPRALVVSVRDNQDPPCAGVSSADDGGYFQLYLHVAAQVGLHDVAGRTAFGLGKGLDP